MPAKPPGRRVNPALDRDLSAADALRLLRADPHPVALVGAWADGSDIVASDPMRVCGAPGQVGEVLNAPLPGSGDFPERAGGACFGGGWIGYLGFGASGTFLPVPPAPGEPQ